MVIYTIILSLTPCKLNENYIIIVTQVCGFQQETNNSFFIILSPFFPTLFAIGNFTLKPSGFQSLLYLQHLVYHMIVAQTSKSSTRVKQ